MFSINRILVAGNLVRDPEVKELPNDKVYTIFTLAVNRHYKTQGGEYKKEASFFKIITWNNIARVCAKYLRKGRAILVEGELVNRSYEDRDGNKRNITQIVGNQISFLSPPPTV